MLLLMLLASLPPFVLINMTMLYNKIYDTKFIMELKAEAKLFEREAHNGPAPPESPSLCLSFSFPLTRLHSLAEISEFASCESENGAA
jgi:hypothetical protein